MPRLLRVTADCESLKRLLLGVSDNEEAMLHISRKKSGGRMAIVAADAEMLVKMEFL